MRKLLQQVIAQIDELPEEQQDAVAPAEQNPADVEQDDKCDQSGAERYEERDGGAPSADNHAFRVAGIYCLNMPVSADTLRMHLDYTTWASARLLVPAQDRFNESITRTD